jgi:hypothetical protein
VAYGCATDKVNDVDPVYVNTFSLNVNVAASPVLENSTTNNAPLDGNVPLINVTGIL